MKTVCTQLIYNMRIRTTLLIFIPAIAFAFFALFISIIQYQPTRIPFNSQNKPEILNIVPIFTEDIIMGYKKAPNTIIEFFDIGCSRCQDQMQIFDELMNKYPEKIKIIVKTLNATSFPYPSDESHKYLFCANEQNKMSDFKSIILASKKLDLDSLKSASLKAQLDMDELKLCLDGQGVQTYAQKNEDLAKNLKITSVPTIFIDNKIIQEPLTLAGWEALLNLN